jgi:hypothetical protein
LRFAAAAAVALCRKNAKPDFAILAVTVTWDAPCDVLTPDLEPGVVPLPEHPAASTATKTQANRFDALPKFFISVTSQY